MSDNEETKKAEEDQPMETEEQPAAAAADEKEADGEPSEGAEPSAAAIESKAAASKSPSKSPAKSAAKTPAKASPAKSPKKTPVEQKKTPTKAESPKKTPKRGKKEESEGEEEEEEEEEEKKGLFDLPVEMEGKRKRASTSFLKVEAPKTRHHSTPKAVGSGVTLGEIPYVEYSLSSEKGADLRPLYRMCYKTMGSKALMKKEIKQFNGFDFKKGSEEYAKKLEFFNKFSKQDLSHVRRILGIAASQKKEDEAVSILDFLVCPKDEGRAVPKKAAAKKRKSEAGGKTPAKRARKETPKKKGGKSAETVDTESGEESEEEEEEEEEVTPKKRKTPAKKRAAVEKKTPKKTPAKRQHKRVKKEAESDKEEEEEDSDGHSVTSSSDSSVKKEAKSGTPTDEDLKAKIDELLKTFDLTSVSMKQMVLAVVNEYPADSGLAEKTATIKAFIKDAIKE